MRKVTSLDEIKRQVEPDLIDIPGFRPDAVITVAVRPIDLTPHLLKLGVGNPLLVKEDVKPEDIPIDQMLPILDEIARQALVEPTYDQITEIAPMTLDQKMAIFEHAIGGLRSLKSFRGQ